MKTIVHKIPASAQDSDDLDATGKVIGTFFGPDHLESVAGLVEGDICQFDKLFLWGTKDVKRKVKITRIQRILQQEDGTIDMISGKVVAIVLDYEVVKAAQKKPRLRAVSGLVNCPDCGKIISTRFPMHDCVEQWEKKSW